MRLGGHVTVRGDREIAPRNRVGHILENVGAGAGGPRVTVVVRAEPAVPAGGRHHRGRLPPKILERSQRVSAEAFPEFRLIAEKRAVQHDRAAVGRHGSELQIRDQLFEWIGPGGTVVIAFRHTRFVQHGRAIERRVWIFPPSRWLASRIVSRHWSPKRAFQQTSCHQPARSPSDDRDPIHAFPPCMYQRRNRQEPDTPCRRRYYRDRNVPVMDDRVDLTDLIHRAEKGDADAADRLFAATYADLCRWRGGGSSPAAVVPCSTPVRWCTSRICASRRPGHLNIEDRVHFLRWAGRVMRSVIVDFARRRTAERRGGGAAHVALTTGLADERTGSAEEILAVHEALEELAAPIARLAQVVELRYFGGLTEPEIAEALGVTERTVRRDWQKGQLLLRAALE